MHEKALAVALATSNASFAAAPNFAGVWRNQMGSTADFQINGADVTGVYTSSSSTGGPPVTSRDLKGYVSGDMIAFTVLWPGGSMTSWVGQMVQAAGSAPMIRTLWHLITDVADAQEPQFLWKSTLAGADDFVR